MREEDWKQKIQASVSFTKSDIWHSQFAIDGIKYDFKKTDAETMTENEYNKFFGNSIAMLHYLSVGKIREVFD